MSKHETFAMLDAPALSPTDFLKTSGLYWSGWRVVLHKLETVARYGVSDSLNELSLAAAFVAVVAAGFFVGVPTLIINLFVPLSGWVCFGIFGAIATALFVTLGVGMKSFPFWLRTDVTKQNRFSGGHRGWSELPEEARNARDLILAAYPDALITVDAFAYDPIMTAHIPGEACGHVVCVWDYDKDGNVVMLSPV